MRIIECIQFFILTVNCKCILCKIVCSNTEEINQFCKFITNHYCSRCFNHNSLFYILVWNLTITQFLLYFLYNFLNLLHFFYRCNHWIHNCNLSIIGGSENRTKLSFKNFCLSQANTNCTITKCRIFFFSKI